METTRSKRIDPYIDAMLFGERELDKLRILLRRKNDDTGISLFTGILGMQLMQSDALGHQCIAFFFESAEGIPFDIRRGGHILTPVCLVDRQDMDEHTLIE